MSGDGIGPQATIPGVLKASGLCGPDAIPTRAVDPSVVWPGVLGVVKRPGLRQGPWSHPTSCADLRPHPPFPQENAPPVPVDRVAVGSPGFWAWGSGFWRALSG